MNARQFLNALNILESLDDVPGMPSGLTGGTPEQQNAAIQMRLAEFRANPVRFLRRADDATRDAIWAEVKKRMKKDNANA